MRREIGISKYQRSANTLAVLLLLAAMPLSATIRVIQFGGGAGFAYSPSSLTVAVGDTIEWQGDFTSHPLGSSTIPNGASSWQCTSGTQFRYVVQVSGTYNYFCLDHGTSNGDGMAGSFTALVTDVGGDQHVATPAVFELEQNYPNPFNPSTVIRYTVATPSLSRGQNGQVPAVSDIDLRVFNLLGQEVAVLVKERQQAGAYSVVFTANGLPSGIYFARLRAGEFVSTRRLVLLK